MVQNVGTQTLVHINPRTKCYAILNILYIQLQISNRFDFHTVFTISVTQYHEIGDVTCHCVCQCVYIIYHETAHE